MRLTGFVSLILAGTMSAHAPEASGQSTTDQTTIGKQGAAPTLPFPTDFSPDRYLGKWYEAARLPVATQPANTLATAEYSAPKEAGRLIVMNSAYSPDGKLLSTIKGEAQIEPGEPAGRLLVSFGTVKPASPNYCLLYVDEDYRYAVVGAPHRKSLHILAREVPVPQDRLAALITIAKKAGFDTSVLIVANWEHAVTRDEPEELTPDQQAIKKNAEAFVAAFGKGDAKAVAALWAENGEMSLDRETVADGRDEVEARYSEYFEENPGAKIDVHIDSIRVVGPTLAIERGYSEVVNDADDTAVDAYRLVYTKQDGAWLIASADVQLEVVERPYDWKADLGFLVGKWRATEGDWSVTTEFEWVPGGNFLKRTFTINDGEEETRTGVQVIGWDAREQSVTSWTFGTDGGHGRGWWSPEGNQWFVDIEGVSPQGEEITAHNVITVLDDNTFRWQSTNRSVAGVSLEDTEPITVRRVVSE